MDQELEKKYLHLFNTFHTDRMKKNLPLQRKGSLVKASPPYRVIL